jgi:hypothetical protein
VRDQQGFHPPPHQIDEVKPRGARRLSKVRHPDDVVKSHLVCGSREASARGGDRAMSFGGDRSTGERRENKSSDALEQASTTGKKGLERISPQSTDLDNPDKTRRRAEQSQSNLA